MQSLKSAGRQEFDNAKDKAKADLNWIKLSSRRGTDQITENNLQEMAPLLFSAVFVKTKKQRPLNTDWEKNCYCHHESDLKIIHHEKILRLILSDRHSSTFFDLINQWLLWKLCYALRKKIETKRTKKQLSLWHGWSFCWTFKHRRQPKRE